ncbi:hypothetical protein ILUMI_18450 [Ignelater luminosus]|uniref:Uncharacterized protein n=1 Tax=Ignelater luminosus TaxID=2038154 RepID=A0A8K0CHZ4_IGNLU|nr:hypothetical protein ILUMI_18450 [Ignelater luminosus]
MLKVRSTVDKWIKSHPDLKYANKTLFCLACVKTISSDKKFNITQHINTSRHQETLKKLDSRGQYIANLIIGVLNEKTLSK